MEAEAPARLPLRAKTTYGPDVATAREMWVMHGDRVGVDRVRIVE